MTQSPEFGDLPWVPPRSYSAGRPEGPPRFVTIHYTAGHEGWTNAEDGAAYDQRRTDGTSSHFYVDADSVVQCVRTEDRSHTALYHGNLWGIHFEMCGTVQTREQWLDDVSRRTIRNTAAIAARCMTKWRIPLVRIVGTGVRSLTAKGVCGHYDWTIGWPEDNGDHTDPGPQFPWDVLFADIAAALGGDDDMNQQQEYQLFRADAYGYALVTGATETIPIPDHTGKVITLPVVPNVKLSQLEGKVAELLARSPVQSAPVDPAVVAAAVKAALSDPDVLAGVAKAVNDDHARRQQA